MARLSNFWVSCIQCPQYWSVSSWNEMRFLRNKSIINHKNWLIIIRNLSKLHGSVKAGTLFTRERVIREVTSQGLLELGKNRTSIFISDFYLYLIKHGAISTEEAPLGCLNHRTLIVLNWEADVKNLTIKNILTIKILLLKVFKSPDIHSGHQHSIHIPGPHKRRCQSRDCPGYPRYLRTFYNEEALEVIRGH